MWRTVLFVLLAFGLRTVDGFQTSTGGIEYNSFSVGSGDCKTGASSGSHTGITSYGSIQATLEDCTGLCADTALCIGVQYTAACNQFHAANSCYLYTGPGDFVTGTNGVSCSECMQVTPVVPYTGANASVSALVEIVQPPTSSCGGNHDGGNIINLQEVSAYDAQGSLIQAVSAQMLPRGSASNSASNCVNGDTSNAGICHSNPYCFNGYYGETALRVRYGSSVSGSDISKIIVVNRDSFPSRIVGATIRVFNTDGDHRALMWSAPFTSSALSYTFTDISPFTPADKSALKAAVEAWCTDSAAATTTYGDINAWDVRTVPLLCTVRHTLAND
jgi:hypothetical protein